jgi:hypothetical protein
VAGEQADRVTDRFDGQREGRGSPKGFSAVEGTGGGEKMAASWSRGHRRGPSSWEGSTQRRGAWGGVETVKEGLEWAVHGDLGRPERNNDGNPDTGSPASACGRFRAPVGTSW